MKNQISAGCNRKRLLSLMCVFIFMVVSLLGLSSTAKASSNTPYDEKKSLQPLGNIFSTNTILKWTPESDPDAKYNRSTIPLQNRFMGPVVNPKSNPDAKVMSIALANTNSENAPSQGSDSFGTYSFSYWQYIDSLVYWGGSSKGIFVIPTPDIVDAAHKNGVPVYATLGFPWGLGAGYVQQVRDFMQKDVNGNFPVADKMIEIAEFYGFDGYFFNQESYGCTQKDADQLVEMITYIKNKKPSMMISWYDSMTNGGPVSYQDALNSVNDRFFQVGDQRVTDEFFLNYNWSKSKIDQSVATATSHNRSPFDVYAGLDVQQNAYNTSFRHSQLVDGNGKLRVSIGLYCPNSTFSMAKDPVDFYKQDQTFWVGPSGDPTNSVGDNNNWTGIARFVADKSSINRLPFVTNFNAGHGKKYFVDGVASRTKEWNNRSLQEYLPTWRWIVKSNGSKLKPAIDFNDAYNGGSSLKISGKLEAANPNRILLYSTDLKVDKTATELSITYKTTSDTSNMQVGLCFGDSYDEENFVYLDVADPISNSWTTSKVSLASYVGKKISAISLKFKSDVDTEDYNINIGQIAILDAPSSKKLQAPASVALDEIMYRHQTKAEARIYWDKVDSSQVSFYEVYHVKPDGSTEFIGATPNNAYYIPSLTRYEGENNVVLEVVSVDKAYQRGHKQRVKFRWGVPENATEVPDETVPENLALNKPVRASRQNAGEPAAKAVDGTSANNSKWCATNMRSGWLEVNLEEPRTVQRWVVEHAEAGGEAQNMNTIDFSLQVSYDGGKTYQDVDAVKGNTSAITDRNLSQPVTSQYFRLNITNSGSSPWAAIRIYEFQLYEKTYIHRTDPVLMHFAKAINNEGASDEVIFNNVPAGYTVNLYSSIDESRSLASKTEDPADQGVVKFTGLDLGKKDGRIYYTFKAPSKEDSLRSSVEYPAENWKVAPIPKNIELKDFKASNSESSADIYGSLLVHELKAGDVIYLYANMTSDLPVKTSAPVVLTEKTASLERIALNPQGGELILELHTNGMRPSEKFVVKYDENKVIVK